MYALNVGGPIVNLGVLDANNVAELLAGSATFQAGSPLSYTAAVVNEGTIALDNSTELATSGNVVNAGTVSLTNWSYSYVGGWTDPASGQFVTPGASWANRGSQSVLAVHGGDVSVYGTMTNAGAITADGGAMPTSRPDS